MSSMCSDVSFSHVGYSGMDSSSKLAVEMSNLALQKTLQRPAHFATGCLIMGCPVPFGKETGLVTVTKVFGPISQNVVAVSCCVIECLDKYDQPRWEASFKPLYVTIYVADLPQRWKIEMTADDELMIPRALDVPCNKCFTPCDICKTKSCRKGDCHD